MTYNTAIAVLRQEDVDLLVAEPPVEESDVTVGPVLFSERRAFVVPAAHPLAARETVALEDFAVLPLIAPVGVSRTLREAHFPRRTPEGRPIEHGPSAVGWHEMLLLVGAGKGATVATVRAGVYHARPDIAYVPFDDASPVDYALMWRDAGESAALQAFVRTRPRIRPRPISRPLERPAPAAPSGDIRHQPVPPPRVPAARPAASLTPARPAAASASHRPSRPARPPRTACRSAAVSPTVVHSALMIQK
ncbi:hypothetical protein BFF78_12205 [Streptomyces fodineus]|uniref:LysR substrate-binding domain-containing protein n=1 Tax=Streptomyces fodineus TaxID=1904616 RepID=A0A1D7Y803_9ACTN|nr:LysR substrate-binding domain-containing protein [Streptomyces fodineus]AOR31712.1 hypothetical protein BFF78_12205 [Streptomyces fodineus]